LISCQNKPTLDQNTALIVDDKAISLNTFRDYYELDPAFPNYRKGEAGLKEYAELVGDKILAAKLARQEDILDNIPYKRAIAYERKKAIIREFYLKEVAEKIQIDEKELRKAYSLFGIKLHVKHLFTPEKSGAEDLYRSLESGIPFDTLAKKVFAGIDSVRGGADLGEIQWGELDPNLEAAAFQMKQGEYSKPIKSRWGYHILHVTAREEHNSFTESDYLKNRSRILKKLKRRKEEIAAGEYLKKYLDPLHIKVNIETFRKIVRVLGIYDENQPKLRFHKFESINDEQIELLRTVLSNELRQPFLTSTNENWSIEDFLNKVSEIPPKYRPQITSIGKFNEDVGILIRNDFILKKALDKGLDKSERVDSLTIEFTQKLAYTHYLEEAYQDYVVSEEVADYYQNRLDKKNSEVQTPHEFIPGMQSLESYRLYYAGRELHQKLLLKFPETEIQINEKLVKEESKRINWNNPIRMFVIPQN
jgi:hypothetical protein